MVVFTDDAWTVGEERIYLVWDHIEVPLRVKEGKNTEFMEKND